MSTDNIASPACAPVPASAPRALSSRELALRTGAVLDLPPRTARLVLVVGVAGLILIVVESLVGNRPETIGIDKLLHFGGYAMLATVFVLALHPRRAVPALSLLVTASYVVELLQPLNMRSLDLGDAVANTAGIALGAVLGLGMRLAHGYIRTELQAASVRRALQTVPAGTTIVRCGEVIDRFFIIQRGEVALYGDREGAREELDRLGPGEMFGILAEIERTPQPVTVIAVSDVQFYRLDYDELIDAVGGPQQPVGIVLHFLAAELRQAADRVSELQRTHVHEQPWRDAPRATLQGH